MRDFRNAADRVSEDRYQFASITRRLWAIGRIVISERTRLHDGRISIVIRHKSKVLADIRIGATRAFDD